MVGKLITWYLHDKSDPNEHYICVDVIEDYIDDDKDVIMKLTLCIVRYIVFTTYIINTFVPKQVDIGQNSAEYTILVCCDASYQIIAIKMRGMSRF